MYSLEHIELIDYGKMKSSSSPINYTSNHSCADEMQVLASSLYCIVE